MKDTGFLNLIFKLTLVELMEKYKVPLMGGGWGAVQPKMHDQSSMLYWDGILTYSRLFDD